MPIQANLNPQRILFIRKKQKVLGSTIGPLATTDGNIVNEVTEMANILNDFFVSVFTGEDLEDIKPFVARHNDDTYLNNTGLPRDNDGSFYDILLIRWLNFNIKSSSTRVYVFFYFFLFFFFFTHFSLSTGRHYLPFCPLMMFRARVYSDTFFLEAHSAPPPQNSSLLKPMPRHQSYPALTTLSKHD